jgi:hypothetical protein
MLNLHDGTLVVAGRPVPFSQGDAVAYQGELYLVAREQYVLPQMAK